MNVSVSHSALKQGGARRLRLILTPQIGLACSLGTMAVMAVSNVTLLWQHVGFDYEHLLAIETLTNRQQTAATLDDTSEFLAKIPGITSVAAFDGPLLQGTYRADTSWSPPYGATFSCLAGPKLGITRRFFEVTGIRASKGRLPSEAELAGGAAVAVISTSGAEACWPGQQPVGKQITFGKRTYTVVGLVPDTRLTSLDERVGTNEFYVPMATLGPSPIVTFVARTSGSARETHASVVRAFAAAGLGDRVSTVQGVGDALKMSAPEIHLVASVLAGLAICAITIVGCGQAGVVANSIAQRMKEMAIRLSVGASPSSLCGLLLREHAMPVASGLALGAAATLWGMRAARQYLANTGEQSWSAWIVVSMMIGIATFLGCALPCRRLRSVNPVDLLRTE
jgi:hypothetical protein